MLLGIPWWPWLVAGVVSTLIGGWLGSRRDRPLMGALLGLALGPVGWLVARFVPFAGDMTCPSCGRRTWFAPMPRGWTGGSGASYPHLRCRRCGEIIG